MVQVGSQKPKRVFFFFFHVLLIAKFGKIDLRDDCTTITSIKQKYFMTLI
jgi:hypothetical protein